MESQVRCVTDRELVRFAEALEVNPSELLKPARFGQGRGREGWAGGLLLRDRYSRGLGCAATGIKIETSESVKRLGLYVPRSFNL